MVVIVVFGVALLLRTKAATTTTASFEAETNAPSNLVIDSSSASGAKTLRFKAPSTSQVTPMYGLTVEDVDTSALVNAVKQFGQKTTVRIVFQPGESAASYKPAITALKPYANIVGLLFDSTAMSQSNLQQVQTKTDSFLASLGGLVDVWEIANEINGEWADESYDVGGSPRPAATTAKVDAMYDKVKAAGYKTALTGMYMPDCNEWPQNEMFTWLNANISSRVKTGVDYAWISYYETNCTGAIFTTAQWNQTFNRFAGVFPNSAIGFGEVGYDNQDWGGPGCTKTSACSNASKIAMMDRYYSLDISTPKYMGGYFWWYAYQDVVPHQNNPLWTGLNNAFTKEYNAFNN